MAPNVHRRAVLIAALVLGACRPHAEPPAPVDVATRPEPEPAATTTPSVVIDLIPVSQGVRAVFQLSEPRTTLAFAVREAVSRHAWMVETPGATLDGDVITSDEPLSRVTLLMRFDAEPRDRVYPSVTRVGRGAMIHVPALLLHEVDFELRAGDDVIVWPALEAPYGYSYLGDERDVVRRGDAALIGFDGLEPWLAEAIAQDTDAALAYYATMLGRSTASPTVVVSDATEGLHGFHGDVTDNAVIFLRFGSDAQQRSREELAASVATFVRHESFHLWDDGSAPGTPPWLHEGAAEYAALVAAATAGAISEDDARRQVSDRLQRCREQSRDRGFADVRGGGLVYDCGVTLQWLADLHLRASTSGASTVFSIWSELLPQSAAGDPYTVEGFRERAGPMVTALLDGEPASRWTQLLTALTEHGVKVSTTPADTDYATAMLRHLVTVACGEGPVGFWRQPDHVRLDTRAQCGPLAGQPRVTRVQGHDVLEAPKRAFDAVARACRKSKTIGIGTLEGTTLELPCATELAPPKVLSISQMPGLAAPLP